MITASSERDTLLPLAFGKARPTGAPAKALSMLQRAQWQLGVLSELAQPGHMELSPVRNRSGRVLDFEWRQSDPVATLTFGCAGEDMFGRRLRESFAGTPLVFPLFATFLRTLLSRRPQFVRVEAGDQSGMHHARPSSQGIKVIVTSMAAVERVIAAQIALRALEGLELQVLRRFVRWDDSCSVVDPLRAQETASSHRPNPPGASTRVCDSRL